MASQMFNDDSDSEDQARSSNSGNVPSSAEVRRATDVNEELVGNLSKYIAYPPGCERGKPQRGYLMFHACFQSGNLGRVDCISPFEFDLFVRPDTCNPRYRVWFNFTVQNVLSGQKVIFNIVNFSKTKSLYREGMSPLVKSTSRSKWQHIPAKNVFYYKSPEHHKNYLMSFAFAFDKETDVYQFAYSYPYTYNRLQNYLSEIENLNLDYFRREQLCMSVQQRNIDLLTITAPKNLNPDIKRHVVFLTARIHPGETPASYVCHGLIDFLISDHQIAKLVRQYVVFMIVPMLNPDGVVLGNYRCSLMGFDLNRYWNEPSPWAHPSIVATKQLLQQMDADPNVCLDFYIDFHAHSTSMNSFMYGNTYDDEARFEQHSVFPRLLCSNADDFSFSNTSFNRDAIKAGTGRRALGSCLSDQSNCYTLEVSFYSFMSGYLVIPYTEEGYMKLGRNVGRTFLDYYKLKQNYLSSNRSKLSLEKLTISTHSRKGRDKSGKRGDHSDLKHSSVLKGRRSSWDTGRKGSSMDKEFESNQSLAHLKMKHKNNHT